MKTTVSQLLGLCAALGLLAMTGSAAQSPLEKTKPLPPLFLAVAPAGQGLESISKGEAHFIDSVQLLSGTVAETFGDYAQPSFSNLDRDFRAALAANPRARLVLRLGLNFAQAWCARNPADTLAFSDPSQKSAWQSPASTKWEQDASAFMGSVVRFLESQPYGAQVDGYLLMAFGGGEWNLVDSRGSIDYSPAALNGFRSWLRTKYGKVEALRQAWHDSTADFEQVEIPSPEVRGAGKLGIFLDPSRSRAVIDFHEFFSCQPAARVATIAAAIKRASKQQAQVGVFYGYTYEINQAFQSAHLGLGAMLAIPNLDFIAAPYSYRLRTKAWRNLPEADLGAGAFHGPIDSILAHGKIFMSEDDTRTHLAKPSARAGDTVLPDLASSIAVLRRNFAQVLCHGAGLWLLDLHKAGWFNSHALLAEFDFQREAYRSLLPDPAYQAANAPDVAVIIDEKSFYYVAETGAESPVVGTSAFFRDELHRTGVACGYYLLSDLVAGLVPDVPCYLFSGVFQLSKREREYLKQLSSRPGKTCIWLYGSGLASDTGLGAGNMRELTGFDFAVSEQPQGGPLEPSAAAKSQMPDLEALKWLTQRSEKFAPALTPLKLTPQELLGSDPQGTALAVVRKNGASTTIYLGTTMLSAAWAELCFTLAKVHRYLPPGCREPLIVGKNVLAVYPTKALNTTLTLKTNADVYDLISGQGVAKNASQFPLKAGPLETRIFILQPPGAAWRPAVAKSMSRFQAAGD